MYLQRTKYYRAQLRSRLLCRCNAIWPLMRTSVSAVYAADGDPPSPPTRRGMMYCAESTRVLSSLIKSLIAGDSAEANVMTSR
jgi:hypothetical protein